ncbi:unnamed protein product [Amoebophrya sp. A25]|nr:unnamed protein product [Amoebophrya sp. A25]|eukprot:GSA25T00013375001.1
MSGFCQGRDLVNITTRTISTCNFLKLLDGCCQFSTKKSGSSSKLILVLCGRTSNNKLCKPPDSFLYSCGRTTGAKNFVTRPCHYGNNTPLSLSLLHGDILRRSFLLLRRRNPTIHQCRRTFAASSSSAASGAAFVDHYAILGLSGPAQNGDFPPPDEADSGEQDDISSTTSCESSSTTGTAGAQSIAATTIDQKVKAAYFALAKSCHPDVVHTEDHSRFVQIQAAYALLRDPEKRSVYDQKWLLEKKMKRAVLACLKAGVLGVETDKENDDEEGSLIRKQRSEPAESQSRRSQHETSRPREDIQRKKMEDAQRAERRNSTASTEDGMDRSAGKRESYGRSSFSRPRHDPHLSTSSPRDASRSTKPYDASSSGSAARNDRTKSKRSRSQDGAYADKRFSPKPQPLYENYAFLSHAKQRELWKASSDGQATKEDRETRRRLKEKETQLLQKNPSLLYANLYSNSTKKSKRKKRNYDV